LWRKPRPKLGCGAKERRTECSGMLRQHGGDVVTLSYLAQDSDQNPALVNMVIKVSYLVRCFVSVRGNKVRVIRNAEK
jgi:hypothetical protein